MAHLDSVSPDYLQKVAIEIGHVASGPPNPETFNSVNIDASGPTVSTLKLTETLTVWKLRPEAFDAIANSNITGDLSKWVTTTSSLYHQIKRGSEPQGFARSQLIGSQGNSHGASAGEASNSDSEVMPTVVLSQISPLRERAQRIDELLKLAEDFRPGAVEDAHIEYDPVVRLLEIPPYHVVALWLYDESAPAQSQSTIAIIDGPISSDTLTPNSFLTSEQFFAALSRCRPICGVVLKARDF